MMRVTVTIDNQRRLRNGLSAVVVGVPEVGVSSVLDLEFEKLQEAFGEPGDVATDFLLVSAIVYLLDKRIPRRTAFDSWTRSIEVELPVVSPEQWAPARQGLQEALRFLTGDEWSISFTGRAGRLFVPPPRPHAGRRRVNRAAHAGVVSLFSGGLDSLIGTIDALGASDQRALLMGHHDATAPAGDQARVHQILQQLPSYAGRTDLRQIRLRPLPRSYDETAERVRIGAGESTQRSRSLVFLALGLYAAQAMGAEVPLLVPENGFIAVNIPLTSSRIGSCSTRTTHPYFLRLIGDSLQHLGVRNPIQTPLVAKTKGEALQTCLDQNALHAVARQTVSCAHATRRTYWIRKDARNCGYCYPCLIRRAAMRRVNIDTGLDYGVDVLGPEMDLDGSTGADWRATLDGVNMVRTPALVDRRLIEMGGLSQSERALLAPMIWRGLEELRDFVRDCQDRATRSRANLQ